MLTDDDFVSSGVSRVQARRLRAAGQPEQISQSSSQVSWIVTSVSLFLLALLPVIFCVSSQNQKGPSPALSATKPATQNHPLALVAATQVSSVKVPTTQPPIDPNDQGIYISALGAENYEFSLDCGEHGGVIDKITVPNFDVMFFSLLVRCEMRQTYLYRQFASLGAPEISNDDCTKWKPASCHADVTSFVRDRCDTFVMALSLYTLVHIKSPPGQTMCFIPDA